MVTITSILTSFRPADDLILPATAFSGVPEFIELVDLESLKAPKDLLKDKIAGSAAELGGRVPNERGLDHVAPSHKAPHSVGGTGSAASPTERCAS